MSRWQRALELFVGATAAIGAVMVCLIIWGIAFAVWLTIVDAVIR